MASKDTDTTLETTVAETDLAQVLDGCRLGDRASQQRLYQMYCDPVFRLVVRMAGLQDAPDITQQVFMQVFRKIDLFTGRSKFATWLYRVAVNESLQHLRKRKRRQFQTLTDEPMSHHQPEYEQSEAKELLEHALTRLEPELRSIFVLREVEGLAYGEIAVAAQIPEGTVGSRLNRARRELKQHLMDLGWEP